MALDRLMESLSALLEGGGFERRPPRCPDVAVEIAPGRIVGVRVTAERKGRRPEVRGLETRDLPPGAIEPSLTRPNVIVAAPVARAIQEVLAALAPREHRVSVLIPDEVARVAILPFATLPRTWRELTDLVRFRMAKALPFKPEEAVLDLSVLGGAGASPGGPAAASVIAAFAHRAVVEQYESLFKSCGYWPGLVGISTFELYNLFRPRLERHAGSDKDSILLNVTDHGLSILIFRDGEIIFYRCKPYAAGGDGVADMRREIYTSLAFYQEKLLGRGLGHAFVRSLGLPREEIREAVTAETGCAAEFLDLPQVLGVAATVSLRGESAAFAAPAAGAVAGRRA